jgi:hypothetical protein
LDYQVRYFASDSIDEVMTRLRTEPRHTYKNSEGEDVVWVFDGTAAVEFDPDFKDGAEIIGFITGRPRETTEQGAARNSRRA